ncbi:MAG: cytochrome P450 [Pseudomonadales bacterium]
MTDELPRGVRLTPHDDTFRDDPHAAYDRLRAEAPCMQDPDYGRLMLTRYADVRRALRHKSFSVDARLTRDDSYARRIAGTGVSEGRGDSAYTPPLVLLDDPAHRRIRGLMSKAFNPAVVDGMRERIEAVTASLLDALRGRGRIDFILDFAGPLPTRVILELLGMPADRWADFKRWSEQILMGYDVERGADIQSDLRQAYRGMSTEFRSMVAARRAAPCDDLISAMVRAQTDQDQLSDLEIISLCTQLMVAGNVTTTDLIGNGLYALLQHPRQAQRLRAEPELIESAVEEMLRFDCPITETARVPRAATRLGACVVHPGDTLTASLAAANHDPEVFERPHSFDIGRTSNPHLGFGSGIHVCLGAPLARLESQIAIRAFLQRYARIELDPEAPPQRRRLPFFRGFTTLPVRVQPAG